MKLIFSVSERSITPWDGRDEDMGSDLGYVSSRSWRRFRSSLSEDESEIRRFRFWRSDLKKDWLKNLKGSVLCIVSVHTHTHSRELMGQAAEHGEGVGGREPRVGWARCTRPVALSERFAFQLKPNRVESSFENNSKTR